MRVSARVSANYIYHRVLVWVSSSKASRILIIKALYTNYIFHGRIIGRAHTLNSAVKGFCGCLCESAHDRVGKHILT